MRHIRSPRRHSPRYIGDVYAPNFGARSRAQPVRDVPQERDPLGQRVGLQRDPFPAPYGIWAAIARETSSTRPVIPSAATNPWTYGRHSGQSRSGRAPDFPGEEDRVDRGGGKYADWRCGTAIPIRSHCRLKEMRCELTVFNGRWCLKAVSSEQ
jgi:hypothetical protein